MTERRRGLGRGLAALLPHAVEAERGAAYGDGANLAYADSDAPHQLGSAPPAGGPPLARPGAEHLSVVGVPTAEYADVEPPAGAAEASNDGPYQYDHPAAVGARFAEVDITSIRPNPRQPRRAFDEDALAELVHSVREVGVLQPVVVRELPPGTDGQFELVMGERRWRAAREAGLATVPAIIRDTPDTALLRDALLENLHRAQLNPLEEAAAYDQLLRDFGCTQDQLAERIGRSRPQISNTIRLLRLPPSVQRRLAAGVLSAGHARALLGLDDAPAQERLAQRIVAEGLSVRSVEEIVSVGSIGGDGRAATARTPRPVSPALGALAERLADRYDTRVRIDLGRTKGRIVVEFATLPDLERIIAVMDPTGTHPAGTGAGNNSVDGAQGADGVDAVPVLAPPPDSAPSRFVDLPSS